MLASPLRYPGGKARLFPFFSSLLQGNGLINCSYGEPYAGGAGLAIRLLSAGYVSEIHLNDLDSAIFSFWKSATKNPEEFCRRIREAPITVAEWRNQRDIYLKNDTSDEMQLGFSAYFLNRTSRSGIIDGSGPIGGYEQAGTWKIDARFIKEKQVANILELSKFADQIHIYNADAMDFVSNRIVYDDSILYLDPPYYVKGYKLYKNFYCHADHEKIAALMRKDRSKNWVVSYDDVEPIREIYSDFAPISYALPYSAGTKGTGKEVIFLSDTLSAARLETLGSAA